MAAKKDNIYSEIHREIGTLLENNEPKEVLQTLQQCNNKKIIKNEDVIICLIDKEVCVHYRIGRDLKFAQRLSSDEAFALAIISYLIKEYVSIEIKEIGFMYMKSLSLISRYIQKIKNLNPKIKIEKEALDLICKVKKEIDTIKK